MTAQWSGGGAAPQYRTSDELAESVFGSMRAIEAVYRPGAPASDLVAPARDFARAILELLSSGPTQYRLEVAGLLPFTELELELLKVADLGESPAAAERVAARLGRWIAGVSIDLGDRSLHVADFLARLWPSLGLWADRMRVDAMIERSRQIATIS